MTVLDRRRFLHLSTAGAVVGLRSLAQAPQPATDTSPVRLLLHPDKPGPTIPANFIGLSYETQQLTDPDFFSPANTGLIAQFRELSPCGVLRLGGNTSDIGWWKPAPSTPRPEIRVRSDSEAGEPTADLAYPITPAAITNLRAFLDATGWTCLYGVNLGTNTPVRAAAEAEFVARTLQWVDAGGRLEYFQLGNEPDLFFRHLRDPKTWSADLYFDQWLEEANAIRARVPNARFGLSDTAGNPAWYAKVVARLVAIPQTDRPHIATLSHHYYFGGPPSDPDVNVATLLRQSETVDTLARNVSFAATQLSASTARPVPYRMSEGNTCYRGGKPGVSDVFAASLWAADYALTLARFGYAGLNLHGGSGKAVAASLGGTLPGELLMADPHAPHPRPFYTPIAEINGAYTPEPVFYGLLFAGQLAGGTMISLDFDPGPVNATAYAATLPTGQIVVAIINKDATQPLHIDVPGYSLARTLTATALDSRRVHYDEPSTNREASIVPPASAILLQSAHA